MGLILAGSTQRESFEAVRMARDLIERSGTHVVEVDNLTITFSPAIGHHPHSIDIIKHGSDNRVVCSAIWHEGEVPFVVSWSGGPWVLSLRRRANTPGES